MKDAKAELKWITAFISNLKKYRIHYSQSTSWTRNSDEGWNSGIDFCIKRLEKRQKLLKRKTQNNETI